MSKRALEIISLEQLRELRACGFVVVHQVPTGSMKKAGLSTGEWPEDRGVVQEFHRMVGESIRLQNLESQKIAGAEWDGEGIPPIGVACEAELYKGGGWIEGFVAYYGKAHFIFESSQLTVGVEISGKIRTSAFRPIRTPEKISADDRDWAKEMMEIANAPHYFESGGAVDLFKWFVWDWSEDKTRPINKHYLCDVLLADGRLMFGVSPHDFDWSGEQVFAARQGANRDAMQPPAPGASE